MPMFGLGRPGGKLRGKTASINEDNTIFVTTEVITNFQITGKLVGRTHTDVRPRKWSQMVTRYLQF